MRGKRRTTTRDCLAVRRLLEAAGIKPERLIVYLEQSLHRDEKRIDAWRQEALKFPDLQPEVTEMEINKFTVDLLVSVLKIALMEGKFFNYSNPSLN